eukprot:scaffold131678_cov60-Phaeocystis_antarctica.AAC.2
MIDEDLNSPASSSAASCPGELDHNFQRVLGSSPRSALYKICANKKIGKQVKGAEDHPEVRRLSRKEEDASALEDAEIPAAHLKRRPE